MDMAAKERSPFTPGVPVPVEYFVGRTAEIETLVRAIRQCAQGRNENIFLTGERGIGKSSLGRFVRSFAQKDFAFVGAHCYLGGEQSLESVCAQIFKRLLEELPDKSLFDRARESFGRYIKGVDLLGLNIEFSREAADLANLRSNFLPKLRELLQRIQPEKRGLVLILDDLNGVSRIPEFANFLKSLVDEMATSDRGTLPLLLMLIGVDERMRDMALAQPSVSRIFRVVELAGMSEEESRHFFLRSFGAVGYAVEGTALQTMVEHSGGLPTMMHEIGDATFWLDQDGRIDVDDALSGSMSAAETVGRKYLGPQVYQAIRSKAYLSILRRIGKMPLSMDIRRSELLKLVPEGERGKLDNFLRKMRDLGVLQQGDERGEYRFTNQLHRLYVLLEALWAERGLRS